ncbi:MAG TPA: Ig-like domain-containing protein, partial [Candidatus Limnocylindria bacterium]|nr:Ig-like domain-containing protein [Candidatus Limnocylindria bacterium]
GAAVPDPTPQTGLHYFLIMNLDTLAVQRGIAGDNGVAFKNLILAPNTHYREFILQASTLDLGNSDFTTPNSGANITLPAIQLHVPSTADSDADGLPDDAEWIMGTDPRNADSDADGILDGAEVQQGTDPLSNVPVRTGIVASADTPGRAVDVCAINDIAIVADSAAGIAVFNVANGLNPTRIAQVDTPGNAVAVACSGNLVVVGDDTAGLSIVDITDPPAARIVHQINLGGAVRAVTAAGGIAYAGLSSGHIVSIDMASGLVLERVTVGGAIEDVMVGGDFLYALTIGTLYALPLNSESLHVSGTASSPGAAGVGGRRLRLFVGGGLAHAAHRGGYNTFTLTNPALPVLLLPRTANQFGWKQMVANGSGFGLAAADPVGGDDGAHDVWLYDLGPVGTNSQFVTAFSTPGLATAISIYNGLAYVADGLSGLQVINYLPYDALGLAPAISLSAGFPFNPTQAEEGKLARITASVSDDVQVRNVEFYVDGIKAATDGNFPFEHRFVTPLLTTNKTNFTVRARAADTGGNFTWSEEVVVTLVPDATPPFVTQVFPTAGAIIGQADLVVAYFSEPIDPVTLSATTFRLRSAGSDSVLDTSDDTFVTDGIISYRDEFNGAFLNLPTNLPAALYRGSIQAPIADLAGNPMALSFTWQFWITGGIDTDQDGIPDDVEVALGSNRFNPDTDGDGILDGDEDLDADGLATKWEILFGYNPQVRDTDGNGFFDDQEDLDNDGLTNGQEQTRRTNANNPDTDGDGWADEAEVTGASDPLDQSSRPRLFVVNRPPVGLMLPRSLGTGGLAQNVIVAQPPVEMVLPSFVGAGLAPNVIVAQPSVSIVLPGAFGTGGFPMGVTIAQPGVSIVLPGLFGAGGLPINVTVAQPPVSLRVPASLGAAGLSTNITIASPPVKVHFANP